MTGSIDTPVSSRLSRGETLRERKTARTFDAIYDAALELLACSPYDEVSVDDICARAEVGRATFFRAFGSKFGLLQEFNRRLTLAVRLAVTDIAHTVERLDVIRVAISDAWSAAGPGALELARAFARSESVKAGSDIHPELIELIAEIVRAGQDSGEIRTDLPASLLAWLWVTALASVVAAWLDDEIDTTLAEASAAMAKFLAAGLCAPTYPS